tara:strand:+ start:998 stop:1966 length:969 start_codon:yes stop_codon:yes gene_type:complete
MTSYANTVQDLYGTHLGRKAAKEGLDYWVSELERGQTVEDITRGIQSGSEYKNRAKIAKAYADANSGAQASDAYLDQHVSPGGGLYDQQNIADVKAGTAVSAPPVFAQDNTWSSPLNQDGEDHWDELGSIYKQLQIQGPQVGGGLAYGTAAPANTGAFVPGTTHTPTGVPINNVTITPVTPGTGGGAGPGGMGPVLPGGGGGGSNTPPGTITPPGTTQPAPGTTDGWWTQFEDAEAFKKFMQGEESGGSSFDQFIKFMAALQGLGGFGGGSGYGYGGYGGFAPGGVRPNFGLNNIMNALNAFKYQGGSGDNNVTTGLLTGVK